MYLISGFYCTRPDPLHAGSGEGGVQAGAEGGLQEGDEEDPLRGAVRTVPEMQAGDQGGRKNTVVNCHKK